MTYTTPELLLAFAIIGTNTFLLRLIFLYYPIDLKKHSFLKNGLEVVPASMLVALVIPFLFFQSNQLIVYSIEMLAILLTVPIIYYTKKPGLGIIFAFVFYFSLQWLGLIIA